MSNTFKDKLGENQSSSCGVRLTHPILAPADSFYGYVKTFVFKSVKKQH